MSEELVDLEIVEMVAEGLGINPNTLLKAIKNRTVLQHCLIDYGFNLGEYYDKKYRNSIRWFL